MSFAERIWYGRGNAATLARAALTPMSWVYGVGAQIDGWRRERTRVTPRVPALSVGNITVGGTGKTPIAAWVARELRTRGGTPAIVMRGYGDDEPLVHRQLNPDVEVVVDGDRVRGASRARELGADCVILDDAFQHRRIARVADWVLVSAEQWRSHLRVLPAGPLREPIDGLRRADVVLVTRKRASEVDAQRVADQLARYVERDRIVQCHFALHELRELDGGTARPLDTLRGMRVLAVTGIGAPEAFFAQLRNAGASVEEAAYPDHHAFGASDISRLVRAAAGADAVVCTLKDAVKLTPMWTPAALPLWYVSQRPVIEHGFGVLDRGLEALLAARQGASSTAGSAGPSSFPNGHRSSTAD